MVISNTSDNYYYYFMQQTPISDTFGGSDGSGVGFNRVYDSEGFIVLSQ